MIEESNQLQFLIKKKTYIVTFVNACFYELFTKKLLIYSIIIIKKKCKLWEVSLQLGNSGFIPKVVTSSEYLNLNNNYD
jgi:hypothetical protein